MGVGGGLRVGVRGRGGLKGGNERGVRKGGGVRPGAGNPQNFFASGFNIQMGSPFSHFLAKKKLSGITFWV